MALPTAAVVLLLTLAGASPTGGQPAPPRAGEPSGDPPQPETAPPPQPVADLGRIRRRLESPSPIRDSTAVSASEATFRVSVDERAFDLRRLFGEPETAVAPYVRPPVGGWWHHEFLQMVTPDEFRGFGGILTNGERAQLFLSQLAFAGVLDLFHRGIARARTAADERERQRAREEVRQALEEFYRYYPEARPSAPR
ncbi:MAG TPA: hypothetical protein VIL35_01995 [Vicinamibacterales bacterium]